MRQAILAASLFLFTSSQLFAETNNSILKADHIKKNDQERLLYANGNVEIIRQDSKLYSDQAIYREGSKIAEAMGHVVIITDNAEFRGEKILYDQNKKRIKSDRRIRIKDAQGNIVDADNADVSDDFTTGTAMNTKFILSDSSVLTSPELIKPQKDLTILRDANYLICPICIFGTFNSQLFAIKAGEVKIHNDQKLTKMRNAVVSFYDLPIAYTPYMQFTTPDVKRKSGFLSPSYIGNKTFGGGVMIPYFLAIDKDKDMTISPTIHKNDNIPLLDLEYRHVVTSGNLHINSSFARRNENIDAKSPIGGINRSTNALQGWMKINGYLNLDNEWRSKLSAEAATDKEYLINYKKRYDEFLTSSIDFYKTNQRNYYNITSAYFDELRQNVLTANSPLILPIGFVHYENKIPTSSIASKWIFDASTINIHRATGLDSSMITATPSIASTITSSNGHVITASASIRNDLYFFRYGDESGGEIVKRIIPSANLTWQLPIAKTMSPKNQIDRITIIPITSLSLYGGQKNAGNELVVNQDSGTPTLSDNNLFLANRSVGYDLIDNQSKFAFGVRSTINTRNIGDFFVTLGQSYALSGGDLKYGTVVGTADGKFSDIVGMISHRGMSLVDLFGWKDMQVNFDSYYKTLVRSKDLKQGMQEFGEVASIGRVTLDLSYVDILPTGTISKTKELHIGGGLRIFNHWSLNSFISYDFATAGLTTITSRSFRLTYNDNCIVFYIATTINKPIGFVREDKTISANISFKNSMF